jgi:uncharacterized membrane protein
MIAVTLYTRTGCHLCDDAQADLDSLREHIPHRLTLVDIDSNPRLQKDYGLEIPVVECGPFRLKAPFTRQDLQVMLAAASDRARHIDMVENSPKLAEVRSASNWTSSDWINILLSKHYMTFFNGLVALYLGLAFLAPVLANAGLTGPANLLYRGYSFVCHQLGYRSFFLGGEQPFYPRAEAGVSGYATFQQSTGLSEAGDVDAVMTARGFIGNAEVGYKVALCERDIAIYGGILLFGLLFALTGFRFKAIPWYLWLLLAIVPVGVDGFSQLLSQPPLGFFPFRESTPWLRVLTGFMFGFFTAWFGYPIVEESMADTRRLMTAKWDRIRKSAA